MEELFGGISDALTQLTEALGQQQKQIQSQGSALERFAGEFKTMGEKLMALEKAFTSPDPMAGLMGGGGMGMGGMEGMGAGMPAMPGSAMGGQQPMPAGAPQMGTM